MNTTCETTNTGDNSRLLDLDEVVLSALDFLSGVELPTFDVKQFQRPLVLGSGNALVVGRVLFQHIPAQFGNESTYREFLSGEVEYDAVIVISASGSKHAIEMTQAAAEKDLPVFLLTNTANAPASTHVSPERVMVFPKIPEPYTYNFSTYAGMLLAASAENPSDIRRYIEEKVVPVLATRDFTQYDAFFCIVPAAFEVQQEMFRTKFDELFGPKLLGRVFTPEQTKHAKTVITSDTECFVSFGDENKLFGNPQNRVHVSLPEGAGTVAMLAIGYVTVGHIQKQFPPYFKESLPEYTKRISEVFGQTITPIVE